MTYVALLRGINVGGNSIVSMRVLKDLFEQLGFSGVRTYINSGNVVFDTARVSPRTLESTLEKAIEKKFRMQIRVVVKSRLEMKRIVAAMPKAWSDTKKWRGNVIFLSHRIDKPSIVKELRFNPKIETVAYGRGALYWAVTFKDLTRSQLSRVAGSPIYKEMTFRNPNTTRKIYDIMLEDRGR
jgi:uncharacterized protein (DUF1697 family)